MLEEYKVINTLIVGLLSSSTIFSWRNAMGVGGFLTAKYISRCRNYLIKYRTNQKNLEGASSIIDDKNTIKKDYDRGIKLHLSSAFLSFVCLIIFITPVANGELKISMLTRILAFDTITSITIFLFFAIVVFNLLYSHTREITLSKISEYEDKLSQQLNEDKLDNIEKLLDKLVGKKDGK